MDNNRILKKLAIAHNLKQHEVQEIFALGDLECSSSRIKGFMAGSGNKNHESVSDSQLESFLNGLIIYARGALDDPDTLPRGIENYVLSLIDDGNAVMLDEIGALIDDARDAIETREAD